MIRAPQGVCGATGVARPVARAWLQSPGASCRKRLAASCRHEPEAAGSRSVHSASASNSAASAGSATSSCAGASTRSWAASWRNSVAVASSAASDLACSVPVQTASTGLRAGPARDATCSCIHALATAALAATALAAALTATALAAAALAAARAAVALAAATLTRGLDPFSAAPRGSTLGSTQAI